MIERIGPAQHLDATIEVPGDKSISHRALILGAIARGRSYIGNCSPADDVESTMRCLRDAGGWVRAFGRGRVYLDGSGAGATLRTPDGPLDCGNSGSTMRLLAGVLAGHDLNAVLDGDASLRRRPMRRVAEPLRAMGAEVATAHGGTAPLEIQGHRPLHALEWRPEVASAQVKSAILLAGLAADGDTVVEEPLPTRDHTERLLRMCGVDVGIDGRRVTVTPGDPQPFGLRVPGDVSSAAFFLALASARQGWRMRCNGVGLNPGRTGFLDVLIAMGAEIEVEEGEPAGGVEPVGAVTVRGRDLHETVIAGELTVRCIDELPVLAVIATQAHGETEIRDAAELRAKESDRIAAVAHGLRALGGACEETSDGLVVTGPSQLHGAHLDSHGDHRLAMAWAVAAALAREGDCHIAGAEAASVSFPGFFDALRHALS
ncbi:MAG: 3-phosphoshikimate 1-carboxyvinyltransferase [Candidatus Dormibacteraeota bacterium]|nr:3-phosphoshikimate 1-carboxyvinyltransferase [Candidatus Dormibacteraeota bacterium]